MPFYLMALWRALGEVEIAHIFSASYWSFMLAVFPAWLVARLRKRKTVINYHSAEARDHLRRWRSARAVLRRGRPIVFPFPRLCLGISRLRFWSRGFSRV